MNFYTLLTPGQTFGLIVVIALLVIVVLYLSTRVRVV